MREVVIEMKVRLLKELTVDHKVEPRAQQFVALLLSEYSNLCVCSQRASFLSTFVCSISLLLTVTATHYTVVQKKNAQSFAYNNVLTIYHSIALFGPKCLAEITYC